MTTSNIQGLRASFTRDEYTASAVFEKEMREVFAANWCHVGQSYQLSHIGDRLVAQIGDESILIVRNKEGELRAFYNVCQHRGSQLCDESGSGYGGAISCPYHAWTYSLNGKLVSAIHHDQESFDRECIALKQVRVDEWQGNLFVNLNEQAIPLIEWLESLYSRPRDLEKFEMGSLKTVLTTIDEAQANWKVLVENYSECLHCSTVHPELCDLVPVYKTGKTTQDDRPDWGASLAVGKTAIAFSQDEALPLLASMVDMDDYSVFGAYVYPNMLIDVMPTCVAISTYIPRSASHTTVVTNYLFPVEVADNPSFDLGPTLSFNDLVNKQDIAVSERVQRGVASQSFTQAYHTEMEKYAQRFVKQYRQDTKTS